MGMLDKIHIGTSGWSYDHWQGPFFPDDLPQENWLDYYSQKLNTVEINNSFYQLPDTGTLEGWSDVVPDSFLFSVKANRYITHMKKLKEPEESLDTMFDTFHALGGKLSRILFQLPPNWNFDEERLRNFISLLPDYPGFVFEFRDKSWINDTAIQILQENSIAFCIYDLAGYHSPVWVTADSAYVRLHGPSEEKYKGCYSEEDLSDWAEIALGWAEDGREVFIYFDNDEQGFAPNNAVQLKEMIFS